MSTKPLRIVTFNVVEVAFQLFRSWIGENGHKHVLAVTTPGPVSRPMPMYTELVSSAPRNVDILVTTRLKTVARPLIEEMKPDLIMCFSFPYRIPPEIREIPRLGAINLHPAVLPAYRGPNALRPFYDGATEYGATVHWMADDFDTGRVLSQASAPMPEIITPQAVMGPWIQTMQQSLNEGAAKAIAGDPGSEQDESLATYAAPYTKEEKIIDWNEPRAAIIRKVTGLNFVNGEVARAQLNGEEKTIKSVNFSDKAAGTPEPGTILEQHSNQYVVQTADGPLDVTTT